MTVRTYKRHLTAADRRAKVIIESCVATGAGIEFLSDAPNFRFVPVDQLTRVAKNKDSFTPTEWQSVGPSKRPALACGRGNVLKLKTWTPSKLDANPMYGVTMKGDSEALSKARAKYAGGDPQPLRDYLRAQAELRRATETLATEQLELMAA